MILYALFWVVELLLLVVFGLAAYGIYALFQRFGKPPHDRLRDR